MSPRRKKRLDPAAFGLPVEQIKSGFHTDTYFMRSRAFEEDGVPVDVYGVGGALYEGRFDFTADIVIVDGRPQAKAGRVVRENPRLTKVT